MNIYEAARLTGGEEAVAEIKRGKVMEAAMVKAFAEAFDKSADDNPGTTDEEKVRHLQIVTTAWAAGATKLLASGIVAQFVALYGEKAGKAGDEMRQRHLSFALTALARSVAYRYEELDAKGSELSDLIKDAAKRGTTEEGE